MAKPALPRGLYAITDPELLPEDVLATRVGAAIEGGAGVVQFRDKIATGTTLVQRAQAVLAVCRAGGALCIINDDVALAAMLGADGVHLGRHDLDITTARTMVGPDRLIGVSCYDQPGLAAAAVAAGADYVAFGSVWPSVTKPEAVRAPLELLTRCAREFEVPVVAIGGISHENATRTVAAGAHCVAVIRELFSDPDPRRAAQRLSAACERGRARLEW